MCVGRRVVGIDRFPCLDGAFARLDAIEAFAHLLLRRAQHGRRLHPPKKNVPGGPKDHQARFPLRRFQYRLPLRLASHPALRSLS